MFFKKQQPFFLWPLQSSHCRLIGANLLCHFAHTLYILSRLEMSRLSVSVCGRLGSKFSLFIAPPKKKRKPGKHSLKWCQTVNSMDAFAHHRVDAGRLVLPACTVGPTRGRCVDVEDLIRETAVFFWLEHERKVVFPSSEVQIDKTNCSAQVFCVFCHDVTTKITLSI